jgi:nucleolar pre-ribosomal-associated protein 1
VQCLANTIEHLPFAVAGILRLSLLPGQTAVGLYSLLNKAVECLRRMEVTLSIPSSSARLSSATLVSCEPLVRACEIHEPYLEGEPLQTWGHCVEALWRATMTMETKPPNWDVLCSRLLLWRAIMGQESSPLGEWARKQVVCNISNE